MRYLIEISQHKSPGGWVRIHEQEVNVDLSDVAAIKIEKVIHEAGLQINPETLRMILREELRENET